VATAEVTDGNVALFSTSVGVIELGDLRALCAQIVLSVQAGSLSGQASGT